MADPLAFESPVVRRYATAESGDLMLADASATTKWLVRASATGAAAKRLGAPFGSSRDRGGRRPWCWVPDRGSGSCWARRTRWPRRSRASTGSDSSDFVTALDWTHGRALFRVTGYSAPRMLEKVCSLDWSDPMTPDGAVASASVAKVTCDIARNDVDGTPSYLVFCDRSFGQYLFDALIDAGDESGLVVGPASR